MTGTIPVVAPPANRWQRLRKRLREVSELQPTFRGPAAYFNWFRANFEWLIRAETIRARPLKLTVDPTNFCQLRCPLCPTGAHVHDRAQGRASQHMFDHLMAEVGPYVFIIDFFNWGEPLLNPEVECMVASASSRGIVTVMSSNLSLPLSDERLRRLVGSGLNELVVSLDGASAATYGQYRRGGNFDLVIRNLRRLIEIRRAANSRLPRIVWQFLVFRFNEHEIGTASALAAELGVDSIMFRAPFIDEGRVPLSADDAKHASEWASSLPLFDRKHGLPDHVVPARPRCGWHYMSSAINWDGGVAPCCTVFAKEHDFGSLSSGEPYMRVVNNAAFRSVRNSFAGRSPAGSGQVCDRCPTPVLMTYGSHINKQIVLHLVTTTVDLLRHPVARFRRRRRAHLALLSARSTLATSNGIAGGARGNELAGPVIGGGEDARE